MKRTTYQVPELRDENDNIIQQGAFGKNTALANSTNDGWIDYVANDLMYLYNNTMGGTGGEINTETITGQTGTITTLTATTVKAGTVTADALSGPLTGNVAGTADKAVADGKGNNIVNTYVTKSDLSSSLSTTSLTVSGETSVPTANTGNSSKAIANTEYVQGELTNYLPLSGGTMTGWLSANADEFRILNSKAEHDGMVSVFGGAGTAAGANLSLYGTSHSSQAGRFVLSATDGANAKSLRGQADGTLTWNGQPLLPVGVVQAFAGTTIPNGWLLCDGSAVSRTTYANLYACIGTTYGAGNGSTTFNLPNLVDKFVEGSATAGTVKSAGLPNITGRISTGGGYGFDGIYNADNLGAFNTSTDSQMGWQAATQKMSIASKSSQALFDASRSSSVYGNSATVQPPALTMRYIIKY